jgi:hypothetical protein
MRLLEASAIIDDQEKHKRFLIEFEQPMHGGNTDDTSDCHSDYRNEETSHDRAAPKAEG